MMTNLTRSIRASIPLAAALLLGAASAPADDPGIQGEWRNTRNTVHLSVRPCGAAMCGTVTWAAEQQRADARSGSGRELVGSVLLRDLRRGDDGLWRGRVYIPDINSNASATVIQLNANLLRVSGCTLFGLACKTQHWHRI